jgi:hypothetical protein
MVSRALIVLVAAVALEGCFDVHSTNVLVIDDFESGNLLLPTDPGFGMWALNSINTVKDGFITYGADSTDTPDHSMYALSMDMTVVDPPDFAQQHGGAEVETKATMGPVDFTRYQRIRFDLELKPGTDHPLPSSALIYLQLGCSSVPQQGTQTGSDLFVLQGVSYQAYWQSTSLTLDNFGPPPWLATPIEGGTEGCLRAVDNVRFAIDAQLADGATGHGILHVDNIVLE